MRLLAVPAALLFSTTLAAQTVPPGRPPAPKPIQFSPQSIRWTAGQPPMPQGTEVAVLEGDPKKEGFFTMRLRVPAGATLPPHWHLMHERVTVLSGAVELTFMDAPVGTPPVRLGAGAYYVNPPMNVHAIVFPEATELQISGYGPWRLEEGAKSAARATLKLRSVSPAAGTAIRNDTEIVVEADYAIEGFRPDMYNFSMQFDTTEPRKTMGCAVMVKSQGPPAPMPPPRERLTSPNGTATLRCRVDSMLSRPEIARPLRFRIFLIESTGEMTGEPIAMSDYVDYK